MGSRIGQKVLTDRLGAALVLLLTLSLTGALWWNTSLQSERDSRESFDGRCADATEVIRRRIQTYVDSLLDIRGFLALRPNSTQEEWEVFTQSLRLDQRYPGFQDISFAPYVPKSQKQLFENRIRIHPPGQRSEYFPIALIEPMEPNRKKLGFDIGSDPVRLIAIDRARRTGQPSATGLTRLMVNKQIGFSIRVPIYRRPRNPKGQERHRIFMGFVSASFNANDLMHDLFGERGSRDLSFRVYDMQDLPEPVSPDAPPIDRLLYIERLLYDDDQQHRTQDPDHRPRYSRMASLDVAGRRWVIFFSSRPHFTAGSQQLPWLVLIGGGIVSLSLFQLTWSMGASRRQALASAELLKSINESLQQENRERCAAQEEAKILTETLEQRVTERTAQLQEKTVELMKVNRDLQQSRDEMQSIAYTTTHDLKTPIVSIHAIASILKRRYHDKLDEEGQRYFDRLLDNVNFMGQLISDILDYTKINRHRKREQRLEPGKIANEVLRQFSAKLQRQKIAVRFDSPLPEIHFDKDQLTLILFHLIGNAINFMGNQPNPTIHIGGRSKKGSRVIYVKDNGIGIAPQYHEIIFAPFHRLKEVETEGTGIGLSIVQKIVHLAGGEIWLESGKEEGSIFLVRLPHREASPETG